MARIETFQSDAAECMKLDGCITDQFVFTDFCLQPQDNTLKFRWISVTSKCVCSITYIASEDYPENCFCQQEWENDGVNETWTAISCQPLPELLTTISAELNEKQQKMEDSGMVDDLHMEGPLTPTDIIDVSSENSDNLDYTDCESRLSSEDEGDTFDFDPVEFYEEMNKGDRADMFSSELDMINPLLRQDIQLFKDIFVTPDLPPARDKRDGADRKKTDGEERKRVYPDLTVRLLETLGEIDCDIHVPLNTMNLAPQLANAWKLHLDEPLVVRLNFNFQSYLDCPEPPKVEVFQPNKKECGIALQMKNILTLFLKELWHKTDNKVLQSNLRRSGSVPVSLSTASWVAGMDLDGSDCSKELQHLLEMGFKETESRSALAITNNNLMEASILLATNNSGASEDISDNPNDSAFARQNSNASASSQQSDTPPPLPPKRGSKGSKKVKRHMSSPHKTSKKREMPIRSISSSHTEPNLTEAGASQWAFQAPTTMDVKKAPSLADGFIVMMYRYIRQRVPRVNEFCVVCDCPHVFQANGAMLMPSVCSRELCLFAFQTLGVMANATADIATGAEVVDLLITMAKAACFSLRQATILNPFPNIVDPNSPGTLALSEKKKDFKKVESLLKNLPPMSMLTGNTCNNLHKTLDKRDPLLYPLLSWIIYSNRSHIVKLPPEKQLKCMATPHQFLLLSSPPAQEKEFQELKGQYGSCFAFHGSSIENWHAIIRQGLIVASGTKFQVNGAAHGKGIYLSPWSTYSFSYSRMGHHHHRLQQPNQPQQAKASAEKHRFLSSQHLNCIALCEVIKSPELHKKTKEIWVVTKESHVCTRFFFVYEDGQVGSSTVDMTDNRWCRLVEEALASCFMAVVPNRGREGADSPQSS